MKLLKLELLRFGPFTDTLLNFATGDENFHVIFGSNEAGKSTALRAVSGLLFGIPERTGDDHVHEKSNLRIGADLQRRSGEKLSCRRRKGRKNTLLDPDENILEDTLLTAWLGGVSKELFETMFGLSHDMLVRGGEDLLAGKGELGESLFAAGIGVRGIHHLRTSLREKSDSIFTPGAQKRPLNFALKSFKESKQKSVQLSLKPREWKEIEQELRKTEERRKKSAQEREEILIELRRLERLQRVLPGLEKRNNLLQQLKALGEVQLLPESCTDERVKAQNILSNADVRKNKLLDEKQRREEERKSLRIPRKLLERETDLEDLRDRLGAHKKAMQDLPDLERRIASTRREAQTILGELGRDTSLEEVEQLRLDSAAQARVRKLGRDKERLDTELRASQKALTNHDRKVKVLERLQDDLPPPPDGNTLGLAVKHGRKEGDLESEVRNLDGEIVTLRDHGEDLLAALSLWEGSLEEIQRLPLPPEETLNQFKKKLDELDRDWALAHEQKREISERLEQIASDIAELESSGPVPNEQELRSARSERDNKWHQIQAAWVEGSPLGERTSEALASEYDHHVHQADDVADRLWHDADRVAKHFTLTGEQQRYERKRAELDRKLEELEKERGVLEEKWRAQWKPADIDPLPPAEMLEWLGRHEKLASLVTRWKQLRAEREALSREIKNHRDRCSKELAALGKPQKSADVSLAILLDRAEEVMEDLDTIEQERRNVSQDLKKAAAEREGLQKEVLDCQKNLKKWLREWTQAVKPLGLGAATTPEEADLILNRLSALFEKVKDAGDIQNRIDHVKTDVHLFAERVTRLTQDCSLDLSGSQAAEAAAELDKLLTKAKIDLTDRTSIEKRLKQIRQDLDELDRDREGAHSTLNQLLNTAGCETPKELEDLERRSKESRETKAKLKDLEEQLLGEGVPIEELVDQAKSVDPDRLYSEIDNLKERMEADDIELKNLDQQMGTLKQKQEGMDGSDDAAAAATEAQEALAKIKGHVDDYIRLKLASLLLNREIERYREQNQGAIMKRAAELFRRITVNSYVDLRTGFIEGDELVLLCIRSTGEHVSIDGLSDGTSDQLYLALRLAGIEENLTRNEPLPLIIDDALIKFDDRRAQATLELLGELSEKTQVLFFTHHDRLVQLASEAIPLNRLKIHNLDRFGSSAAKGS